MAGFHMLADRRNRRDVGGHARDTRLGSIGAGV
jgi:hypothetical protein